jgi:hypothetical protein
MASLRFDVRDLLRAPRLALSPQRLWIQLCGFAVGYAGYLLFTYLSFAAAGESIARVWARSGLLPCLYTAGVSAPWYSWAIWVLGSVFLVASYLVSATAVARSAYMVLKGNHFFTWREAYSFSLKKAGSVLLSPVSLAGLAFAFVVGAWVIGLLGRIPYVGELGLTLFTLVWLAAALFLFFLVIAIAVALLLAPSVIATTGEDAFEAVFQTFSTTWSQPWRLVFYQALSIVLAVVGFFALAFAVKTSLGIMNQLFAFSMGTKYTDIAMQAQALLQSWTLPFQDWLQAVFGPYANYITFTRSYLPVAGLQVTQTISAYLFSLSLLFAAGWVVSYLLATYAVGSMIGYVVIRKKKDDENLLERKEPEEFEAEEPTTQPTETTTATGEETESAKDTKVEESTETTDSDEGKKSEG